MSELTIMNLQALTTGRVLNAYQRALAKNELKALEKRVKELEGIIRMYDIKILLDMQANPLRWFTQEEFETLQNLLNQKT